MLRLALIFLIVSMIASCFGFGVISGASFEAAKILFFVFLVLAVVAFVADAFKTNPPYQP